MKPKFLLLTWILALSNITNSALAQSTIEVFGYPDSLAKIYLAPGSGVTLNFQELKDAVTNIWLDNPSFATFVTNCAANSGSNCRAQVIHLKRIKDLVFPGLPSAAHSSLTILFESGKILKFSVNKAREPSALLFSFKPVPEPVTVREKSVEVVGPQSRDYQLIYAFLRGIGQARNAGYLTENSTLNPRLEYFLDCLWRGCELETARNEAGLSSELINSVFKLGGYWHWPEEIRRYQDVLKY